MLTDESQAHAAPMQFIDLAFECAQKQIEQRTDFILWPLPVFAGKREQGQHFDTRVQTKIDAQVNRARASAVSDRARTLPLPRPAANAVKDDGPMARNRTAQSRGGQESGSKLRVRGTSERTKQTK